ncbi:hypothetical protein CR513_35074, partial [Mucuna pruriens]
MRLLVNQNAGNLWVMNLGGGMQDKVKVKRMQKIGKNVVAKKDTKKVVSKVRVRAFDELYLHQSFGTKGGKESHETWIKWDTIRMKKGTTFCFSKQRKGDQNFIFYHSIWEPRVKEALKRMANSKVVGLNNMQIEVWMDLGEKGISWLTKLVNEIMRSKKC